MSNADEQLPVGSRIVEPLPLPHFPTSQQVVVWRNWEVVPVERLADVLQLSSDPKFHALSNARKQQMGEQQMSETLIILTNFMDLGHTVSIQQNNEPGKRAYRQMAGMLLQGMLAVNPHRVSFTKTGLVITQ